MKIKVNCVTGILMTLFFSVLSCVPVSASDGEYITISVDATDDNGNLLYALDTDESEAFSSSNEFRVPAGTSHTIYVKDTAGNISSQVFTPSDYTYTHEANEDERMVNIDVTLNDIPDYSDYEYAGDIPVEPAENGQGTVYDKVTTDTSDSNSERIFYTVTTDEGEVFYLVIDQNQNSNNVYLLDQVNISDLKALAVNDSGNADTEGSSSLLSALNGDGENKEETLLDVETPSEQNSTFSSLIVVLIIAAAGGGFYYYKNIYKSKKDEQMDLIDAPDKDDFAAEDDDEDEVDFGLDDDYQEQIMAQLMEEDDISEEQRDEQEDEETMQDSNESPFSFKENEKNSAESYATSHNTEMNYQESEEDEYDEELDGEEDE